MKKTKVFYAATAALSLLFTLRGMAQTSQKEDAVLQPSVPPKTDAKYTPVLDEEHPAGKDFSTENRRRRLAFWSRRTTDNGIYLIESVSLGEGHMICYDALRLDAFDKISERFCSVVKHDEHLRVYAAGDVLHIFFNSKELPYYSVALTVQG